MGERFFSRNKKYTVAFDKDAKSADLLRVSKGQNTPEIVKKFSLTEQEFSPDKYHREKQLCKHVLGYLIKEKKMSMRELNEYAIKSKLVTPGEILLDTLSTKIQK